MRRKVISIGVVLAIFAAGGALGTMIQAVATPNHTVSMSDATANEDDGTMSFTLTLAPTPVEGETISAKVVTANVNAAGGASCSVPTDPDYVTIAPATAGTPEVPATEGTPASEGVPAVEATEAIPAVPAIAATVIKWVAGETTKTQTVTLCQDGTIEEDETFELNASSAGFTCNDPCEASAAPTMADPKGVGTIVDDELAPALSIGDLVKAEGDEGQTDFAFPVTLSAASDRTVKVDYTTVDVTADSPDDYEAESGELTFAPDEVAESIPVNVVGDNTAETDETFFVNLSDASNASIIDPQGVGIIQNDDGATPDDATFSISDVSVDEGNSGSSPSTPFTFVVTLSQPPATGDTNTVNYHTSEGSATDPSDFVGETGELVFNAGQTAKTVSVDVLGDSEFEPNETFKVFLTSPNCTLAECDKPLLNDAQGTATIGNDDTAPPTPTPTPTPSGDPTATPSAAPTATPSAAPTATPSPAPSGTPIVNPAPIDSVLKIGGYFQMRVTAFAPCQADRKMKIKQSVLGTDRVIVEGVTDSDGLYKIAKRPIKAGRFYGQVYDKVGTRPDGRSVTCNGAKSPIRLLGTSS